MEHKTLAFEVKAIDYEGRTLEGFAAAFGNIDQVGDIIHPGAFSKTLLERGQRIKFLWQHDPNEPIGRMVEAREQSGGLYVKAVISDTTRGRDAIALLKDGAIGEMSIGYDAVKGGTDYTKSAEGKSVRNLREIKLYEFSLVTFPANEQAIVTALKEADPGDADEGDESEPDAEPEIKAGRTISRATTAQLKAAVDALNVLIATGEAYDAEEEDEEPEEMKSAPGGVPQAADNQQQPQAGPVSPPTSKSLLLEIEIGQEQLKHLEV